MNKVRRKLINAIIDNLISAEANIESVLNDEQEYYDNMPEPIQDSVKGEVASDCIDNLQNALDSIMDVIDLLNASIS